MNITRILLVASLLATGSPLPAASDDSDYQAKTVIGPRNPNLAEGAQKLLAGRIEEGIRLTRLGLDAALGRRERQAALGNLCAGYLMIGEYPTALEYCDRALDENDRNWRALCNRALVFVMTERYDEADADLSRGEALAPHSESLKEVRGMLLDAIQPVTPNIEVDDRRGGRRHDDGPPQTIADMADTDGR